jgi:20S proteasome alpha/beta subunit
VEKIIEIDGRIGCAMSELIADARTLVEHARVETQIPFLCGLKFFYL